ncbi:MAG: hypothetical protein D6813_06885 [Calditrichaeota bacterium]|nr:MAG: hypothetical protein D6813_06885 [Calditrichota bacterium]
MKIKINSLSDLFKASFAIILLVCYWFFVNHKIVSPDKDALSLLSFFLLMCTATAYFPLPANILVLIAVRNAHPAPVAFLAGLATMVAYLSEYLLFTRLFKFKNIAKFKNSWIYLKMTPLFNRHRFFILSFASFLPLPTEALRIYAITTQYSKLSYMSAGFVGRVPRYFLLGYFGKDYVHSMWFLVGVFLFPAVFLLILKGGSQFYNYLKLKYFPQRFASPVLKVPTSTVTPHTSKENQAE